MKKLNFLFSLMLFTHVVGLCQSGVRPPFVPAQKSLPQARGGNADCRKDSTLIFNYGMPVSTDQIEERVLYTYGNNFEFAVRFRRDQGGPLLPFSTDSTAFNTDHQPTLRQTQSTNFVTGPYITNETFFFPCPATGNCAADSTVQFVSIFPGSPVSPYSKNVRFYDNLNRLQQVLIYTSGPGATAFKLSQREDYEYEPATGRLIKVLQFVRGNNNDWLPSFNRLYTYTTDGTLLRILEVDAVTNEPSLRYVYSENTALGYRQTVFSYWNPGNGNWNLPVQITRDYDDAFGRPVAQVLVYNLGTITGTDSTRYEYVPNTDCLQKIKQFDGNGASLTLYRETVHFYGKSVATNTPTADTFNVYPSPASAWLTVEGAEGGLIRIMDLRGVVVYQQTARTEQELVPVQQWAAGTYLVSVQQQGKWASRLVQVGR